MTKNSLIYCILFLPLFSMAQKAVNEKAVPGRYLTDFQTKFPDAKQGKWFSIDSSTYEVKFEHKELQTAVTYKTTSTETRWEIENQYIPRRIRHYVETNYKKATLKSACLADIAGRKQYEVLIKEKKKETLLTFDIDSKFIEATEIKAKK